MLTAIYENGNSITNPQTASVIAVEVHQCANGQFDVRDQAGARLTGPFKFQETANSAARMLSAANGIAAATERIVESMRG